MGEQSYIFLAFQLWKPKDKSNKQSNNDHFELQFSKANSDTHLDFMNS